MVFPADVPAVSDAEVVTVDWGNKVKDLANALKVAADAAPLGIIARGERATSSTTTTSIIGVLRLDNVPLTGGRGYQIWTSTLHADGTVANDVIRADLRITIDGSAAGTANARIVNAQMLQPSASAGEQLNCTGLYVPGADLTFSVLLCVARAVGTGSVGLVSAGDFPIQLTVEDIGVAPSNTGVAI